MVLATITEDLCGRDGCTGPEAVIAVAIIAAFCFVMWLFFQ